MSAARGKLSDKYFSARQERSVNFNIFNITDISCVFPLTLTETERR
jgi:hypothetical protein